MPHKKEKPKVNLITFGFEPCFASRACVSTWPHYIQSTKRRNKYLCSHPYPLSVRTTGFGVVKNLDLYYLRKNLQDFIGRVIALTVGGSRKALSRWNGTNEILF